MIRGEGQLRRGIASVAAAAAGTVLLCLPCVKMTFVSAPGEEIVQVVPAFSALSLGYGNWFSLLSLVLMAAALVLAAVRLFRPLRLAAAVCCGVSMLCLILSWICFGSWTLLSTGALLAGFAAGVLQVLRGKI